MNELEKAMKSIGDQLEAAGCPCRCVCHKAGTFTMVKCQCCENGNKVWPLPKGTATEGEG